MPQTKDLLNLLQEFPAAFVDPEQPKPSKALQLKASQNEGLLALMGEFPQAFADPEAQKAAAPDQPAAAIEPVPVVPTVEPAAALPAGYTHALHRQISTFAWGQIDCELNYGQAGLERIWITVGKSGTEVQSLCEAIARLVNLLLASGTPISTVVKELRGIRGGDAEGFGPHRVLGLADLIGKVLQEAPEVGAVQPQPAVLQVQIAPVISSQPTEPALSAKPVTLVNSDPAWANLPTDSRHSASLCPECGSELHQMNGCSGGACNVCGYSSCS
jgi:hypothetical protein